jgi:hypothetical protein
MKSTIDMAIDAGLLPCSVIDHNDLKAFEALVRADERERCNSDCFKALVGKGVGWEIRQLVSNAIGETK